MTPQDLANWRQILDGETIGPYTLVSFLGHGNFGLVYEGKGSSGSVAIKCLVPYSDAETQLEFDNEGRLLRTLRSSSNVVTHMESGQRDFTVHTAGGVTLPMPIKYHVLELASACLEELLIDTHVRKDLRWSERFRLWRGILRGVHQMHLRNIVHRDLKSSNCLVFVGGGTRRTQCKVADLGRSKDLTTGPLHDPVAYLEGMGDLRFAPPEYLWGTGRWSAEAHKAADLYGLGSALFEVAHGVGITSYALGPRQQVVRQVLQDRQNGIGYSPAALKPRFEPAWEVFGEALPGSVRVRGMQLLARLCDPDPESRTESFRRHYPSPSPAMLEGLFREADILIKASSIEERTRRAVSGSAR